MSKAKAKGARIEREIRDRHLALGIPAEKMPLSGALGGEWSGDLRVAGMKAEVKARARGAGFTTLEKWLGSNDLLFLRKDRSDPMVVLSWDAWSKLIVSAKSLG